MANAGSGKKSKFAEKLNKIRLNRFKRKKTDYDLENAKIAHKNFMKVVAVIPLVVADNVLDNVPSSKKEVIIKKTINDNKSKKDLIASKSPLKKEEQKSSKTVEKNVEVIKNADKNVNNIKDLNKKEDVSLNEQIILNYEIENNVINKDTKESRRNDVEKLEKRIINLIKKDLVKIVNELEILESELYILNEVNNDEKTLEECKKNISEVKKILSKIDKLKHKYDYLKDNYDFEYLLEIDNNELMNDIIELKNKISKEDIKNVVKDYKLLDVYKYLYTEIEDIRDNTNNILKKKNKKEEELKQHNVDFGKLKEEVFDIGLANNSYSFFVLEQNNYLSSLEDRLSKIDSYEEVSYRLRGFNILALNSLKYLTLIMLNPLKGIIPSIATQTIVARDAIKNLRNNLHWEENRKMVYMATNYESELNSCINDIDLNSRMIDATLEDLSRLKMECISKFKEYKMDISGYEDTINKINSIQNRMLGNKIKLELMKNRTLNYKKENEKKLNLVRKLNNEQNEGKEETKN